MPGKNRRLKMKNKNPLNWVGLALFFSMDINGFELAEVAAWMQANGSFGAIFWAIVVFRRQNAQMAKHAQSEQAQEVRNLLRSFHDEITVVTENFEKGNGRLLLDGKNGDPFYYKIPVMNSPFPIYENSVGNIGKIPDDHLRRLIVIGYGRALGFVQNIRMNNMLIERFEQADHLANFYKDDVHFSLRERSLNVAKKYGDTLRESYIEAKQSLSELSAALESQIKVH